MKRIIILLGIVFPLFCYAQEKGNVNYESGNLNYNNQNQQSTYRLKDVKAPVKYQNSTHITIEVAGIYNIDADSYIATFATTQTGTTAEETDKLMSQQIESVKREIKSENLSAEVFVDMISFVPMYEYEVEKKVFSKKTYKEIPKGFELKKNLHIKYKDPKILEELISICAKAEIYDMVKVDYHSDKLEQYKNEMRKKAVEILNEKLEFNNSVLNIDLKTKKRTMGDGFLLMYPVEQYSSYSAYFSSSLFMKKSGYVQNAQKNITSYYDPIFPKSHDFVMNSGKVEPSMQLLYTISVTYDVREKEEKPNVTPPVADNKPDKEYILITSTGQIKVLPID